MKPCPCVQPCPTCFEGCDGMPRFWTYLRDEWTPTRRWLPSFGGDEHNRRTIVLPIPFSGWFIVALWKHAEELDVVWSQS